MNRLDHRWRDVRMEAAHESMAQRHPLWTLYGRTWTKVGGVVLGLGILAHWVGIL